MAYCSLVYKDRPPLGVRNKFVVKPLAEGPVLPEVSPAVVQDATSGGDLTPYLPLMFPSRNFQSQRSRRSPRDIRALRDRPEG